MSPDTSALPGPVEQLLRDHLEGSFAALAVVNLPASEEVRDMRMVAHVLNAASAHLLTALITHAPDEAARYVTYLEDQYADGEGLAEWVTEQLISRGVDLDELTARARAEVTRAAVADAAAARQPTGTRTVTVNGASDDLIVIGGDLTEEFTYLSRDDDPGDLVAFPDGTVLRVVFGTAGIWRITPAYLGTGTLHIDQAHGDDARTDAATLAFTAPAVWALHGTSVATLRRPAGHR